MSDNLKHPIDVDSALAEDKAYQEGVTEYDRISDQAMTVSEEMASTLIESVVKSVENKDPQIFSLSTAVLATAKTLAHLTAYAYDNEDSYKKDIEKARELVVSSVIPALLDPRPCGLCDNCKNGRPELCITPVISRENVETRFLPLVSCFLLEYDLWAKILYMHTGGKVEMPETMQSVDKSVDNVDNNDENGGN